MKIGTLQLAAPFCQAGLAGYSDRAMRTVARRRGCPYAVTEAMLDTILCNGGKGLAQALDISDEDHPVAGQIIGAEGETMAVAARQMHAAGFDVIDLNYACPVKKIKNRSRGGHMLRDVPRAIDVMKQVRDALPASAVTTASLRRAFDESAESEDQFYQVIEALWVNGYSAVRVHARTVEQKYLGASQWDFLRDLKKRYPHRILLGSGDVFTAHDAVRMLQYTGVDMAWIARGAIGNPWIFDHACALLADPDAKLSPPDIHEQREALREHFALAMEIHGEQLAGRRMRKMGIKYARFHPHAPDVKKAFIAVHSLRDWQTVLDRYYAGDGPGVWPAAGAVDEVNDLQSCEAGA